MLLGIQQPGEVVSRGDRGQEGLAVLNVEMCQEVGVISRHPSRGQRPSDAQAAGLGKLEFCASKQVDGVGTQSHCNLDADEYAQWGMENIRSGSEELLVPFVHLISRPLPASGPLPTYADISSA